MNKSIFKDEVMGLKFLNIYYVNFICNLYEGTYLNTEAMFQVKVESLILAIVNNNYFMFTHTHARKIILKRITRKQVVCR